MTAKNFIIKNGLTVGTTEVIDSSGRLTGSTITDSIDDRVNTLLTAGTGITLTYDDSANTLTIDGQTGDVTGVTAGTGLSGGGTSGDVSLAIDYSATWGGNLIPDGNETRDLGSSSARWNDLYLAGSTINLGGTELSKDSDGNVEVSESGTLKSLKVAEIELGTGSDVLVLKRDSNGKLQSRSKNTSTKAETATDIDLSNNDSDDLSEGSSNLYYTDARVKSYLGGGSFDGNIIPSADNTYDLGSSSKMWKDVYIGPGSLYVNGQKVIEDDSGTIVFSADDNQNMSIQPSGSGDLELDPTGSGVIAVKGPLQIEDGQNITNSAGNEISFSNNIVVDAIASKSTDTNLVLSGNGSGNVTLNDNVAITGDLTVSGTTTTVNSETISLADNIIALNSNFTSGSPTEDSGISITRGGSAAKTLLWDETNDKWTVGSETFVAGTFEGNLTGNVTGTVSDVSNHDTDDVSEGSSNLYYTDTRARAAITVTDAGGDGSLAYSGGTITYTGPSAAEVRAHITAGTGVSISSGEVAIGQAVSTSSNVEFTQITTNYANNSGGVARNVYQSTSAPTSSDGAVGDLWILYS